MVINPQAPTGLQFIDVKKLVDQDDITVLQNKLDYMIIQRIEQFDKLNQENMRRYNETIREYTDNTKYGLEADIAKVVNKDLV